jgi:hypothetical protein
MDLGLAQAIFQFLLVKLLIVVQQGAAIAELFEVSLAV